MTPSTIAIGVSLVLSFIILGFALAVLWKVFVDKIKLDYLICETSADTGGPDPHPKASLSRFQFLIFTFVIAGLYLVLCIESGTLLEIPPSVLGLIGVSGGSFVISKGIGKRPE